MKSPYDILGIPSNASPETIRTAYLKKAQMYHPDKVMHLGPEFQELAEQKMREINQAYAVLQEPMPANTNHEIPTTPTDEDLALSACLRGITYVKTGKMLEAIHEFSTTIRLYPSYALAYRLRAQVYGLLDEYLALHPDPVLRQVLCLWPMILGRIRAETPVVHAQLNAVMPIKVEQQTVVLLATKGDWQQKVLQRQRSTSIIEQALTQALDRPISIRVTRDTSEVLLDDAPNEETVTQTRVRNRSEEVKHIEAAAADYDRYLSLEPHADDRPQVEAEIAQLRVRLTEIVAEARAEGARLKALHNIT